MMSAWMLSGCAKGVDEGTLSFGPIDPTADTATSNPPPFDPTTGGQGMTGDSTGAPPDDDGTTAVADGTTGPVDPDTSTGPADPDTSTGPAGPVCGDGMAEPGEECDGADLAGLACPDLDPMFMGGTLACDDACAYDTSGCTAAANPIEVCQVVNAAITDNSTTSSTIVLPPELLGGTIADVDVEVELDHTYLDDLVIDVNANGTSVIVFNRCFSEENLHATFDDEAGAAFDCGNSDANETVTVTSFATLSALDGAAVTANWTLDVADLAILDQGTLQRWCVTITWM